MYPFWTSLGLSLLEVVITGAIRRENHQRQQTNIQLFTGRMPFLSPSKQYQSTEDILNSLRFNGYFPGKPGPAGAY